MTNVTKWAKLLYNPKPAKSTIPDAKPELNAQVEIDGEKVPLYWGRGGLCDYLQKGDTIMVEWIKEKWKICKSPTPELQATLEQRKAAAAPAAPTDAPAAKRPDNDNDIIEMGSIAQKLAAMLPDWTEQAIASLSCTVFIQRGK